MVEGELLDDLENKKHQQKILVKVSDCNWCMHVVVCKLIKEMFVYHQLCYFDCDFDIYILKKNNFAFSVSLKICASEFHEDDFMVTFY